MTNRQTRGQRNLNPLNIRKGDNWLGLATVQSDPDFCVFAHPAWGFRAACKILQKYAIRDVVTIAGIITRWAPPCENDTAAYVSAVCRKMGATPDTKVWPRDKAMTCRLLDAMSRVETCGWSMETIEKGYELAQLS